MFENITQDEDGASPWKARHKEDFKGEVIPFGCGVFFLPASTKYSNSKTAPSMSYGIFMGYRMAPGGKWSGEYLVADLFDFVDMPLDVYASEKKCVIRPHITEQIRLGKRGVCFPLKPKYDKVNLTLEGQEASSEWESPFKYDFFWCPQC